MGVNGCPNHTNNPHQKRLINGDAVPISSVKARRRYLDLKPSKITSIDETLSGTGPIYEVPLVRLYNKNNVIIPP